MTDYATQVESIPVHIKADDTKTPLRPKECRVTHKTIVLTAANPSAMAAQIDPKRVEAHIEPMTNAVVMSSSIGQANDPSNTVVALINPNGRVLNPLVGEYIVPGGANELWFTAGTYPTMVGVTLVREI